MNIKELLLLNLVFLFALSATTPVKNLLADRTYCGYQHTDDYVRPNDNISIDEYPWMAQLVYSDSKVACSGSLINNRYVLTAAHCLISRHNKITKVRLGDYNLKTEDDCVKNQKDDETECSEPLQQFEVEEIILHASFRTRTKENDIALIRLSEPVTFSDYVRPICLPKRNSSELIVGELFAVSGWGLLGIAGIQTDFKKRIMATLLSNEECTKLYNNTAAVINTDHLCVSETDSFTCSGDSGGPLMYSVKTQWEQVGIVSYSKGCGLHLPTVYVKVSKYLDWIEKNLHP